MTSFAGFYRIKRPAKRNRGRETVMKKKRVKYCNCLHTHTTQGVATQPNTERDVRGPAKGKHRAPKENPPQHALRGARA